MTAQNAAGRYLAGRGLHLDGDCPEVLRFHGGLPYRDGESNRVLGTFPALLAAVTDPSGALCSIHRTYLTPDGAKAPVPHPKKLMSPAETRGTRGAAIRLYPPAKGEANGHCVALAEGVETALAVRQLTGRRYPVLSVLDAGRMQTAVLPPWVRMAWIYADRDRNQVGQRAAEAARERFAKQGRQVRVHLPTDEHWRRLAGVQGQEPEKGIDWLDVLQLEQSAGGHR